MAADTLQATHASLSLSVNDLARSRHFYVDGLGFTVEQEWKNDAGVVQGLMLKAGQASVRLSQDDFAKGRDRAKGVGLSLYLETGQDIAAVAQRVRAAGITWTRIQCRCRGGRWDLRCTIPTACA